MIYQEAIKYSIVENLERADLTPMEEARAFQNYLQWIPKIVSENSKLRQKEMGEKIDGFAKKLPVSDITIRKRLSLLNLPDKVQTMLEKLLNGF
ncbi:MAG: Nucleoid occlusion protein [Candidatus Heimdallarchaeota archaeon LC_3]|nr:MAG: Nucleoid occlusion protein [Candidatus Heimdallarchaeota archaeon LC_3]